MARALESVWQLGNLCGSRLQPRHKTCGMSAALASEVSIRRLSHRLCSPPLQRRGVFLNSGLRFLDALREARTYNGGRKCRTWPFMAGAMRRANTRDLARLKFIFESG